MSQETCKKVLVARFRRLMRRLQVIEDELVARGESLLGLALQPPDYSPNTRTASLLRRMDIIDAELVAVEALLPEDYVDFPEEENSEMPSLDLDIGAGPFDFRAN